MVAATHPHPHPPRRPSARRCTERVSCAEESHRRSVHSRACPSRSCARAALTFACLLSATDASGPHRCAPSGHARSQCRLDVARRIAPVVPTRRSVQHARPDSSLHPQHSRHLRTRPRRHRLANPRATLRNTHAEAAHPQAVLAPTHRRADTIRHVGTRPLRGGSTSRRASETFGRRPTLRAEERARARCGSQRSAEADSAAGSTYPRVRTTDNGRRQCTAPARPRELQGTRARRKSGRRCKRYGALGRGQQARRELGQNGRAEINNVGGTDMS
ncbi:hypothetical protein CERSUDRAFT_119960 [Gelatoporia subvermispora B]|uniref:Uncharacterized protein n=1 Tax=Ceriporiopsis subvermispora (strain B) TaxID=914234 RepID=M2QGT5_CERS8|nr:hypothetical protein CERSUDRAFT_119960 [Gelatoporia subvermispora B]